MVLNFDESSRGLYYFGVIAYIQYFETVVLRGNSRKDIVTNIICFICFTLFTNKIMFSENFNTFELKWFLKKQLYSQGCIE